MPIVKFTPWANGDLYIPDLAIGRLVETPEQIIAQIGYFLDHLQPRLVNRAAVAGYDFIQDAALAICSQMGADTITTTDCNLIGDTWSISDLRAHLLGVTNDLISLNTHATHASFGAPLEGCVGNAEVMSSSAGACRGLSSISWGTMPDSICRRRVPRRWTGRRCSPPNRLSMSGQHWIRLGQ